MSALLTKTRHIYTKNKNKNKKITYLEEIVNTRVLKILQRHVVEGGHIHIRHRRHEPLPSQVLISKKVLRNFFTRLRRGGCVDCGRDLLRRRVLRLRVKIKYLHWRLLIKDERSGSDILGLRQLVFFLLTTPTWEITQINPR